VKTLVVIHWLCRDSELMDARRRCEDGSTLQLCRSGGSCSSDHPLRTIRQIVNDALVLLEREFAALYSPIGRPSIAPEKLSRSVMIVVAPETSAFSIAGMRDGAAPMRIANWRVVMPRASRMAFIQPRGGEMSSSSRTGARRRSNCFRARAACFFVHIFMSIFEENRI
jgi:hypothetical protein